jgi:hypothetical protein
VRRADSSARTNARPTRAASFGFLFKFSATVLRFMVAAPSVTQTRYVLPAATRDISQMLVNCLGRSAELLLLLFCDLGGGLVSLPASQQIDPSSGRLLGRAFDLEALDFAHLFHLYHEHGNEADGHVKRRCRRLILAPERRGEAARLVTSFISFVSFLSKGVCYLSSQESHHVRHEPPSTTDSL